jgi:hypothetical protein
MAIIHGKEVTVTPGTGVGSICANAAQAKMSGALRFAHPAID